MNYKYYVSNPKEFAVKVVRTFLGFLPDKVYLQLLYYIYFGRFINFNNPKRFTEKLQWLKIYYRKPELHTMVDKIEAKHLAASIIGQEHIIPTLGIWDNFDDIVFSELPDRFVLKTNNGGGGTGVIVVKDKAKMDLAETKVKLERSKNSNVYKSLREWPYKGVKGCILAEQYLEDDSGDLRDYKFYCFDGEVKYMLVASNRFTDHNFNYFDRDFNPLPITSSCGGQSNSLFTKPECFDEMIRLAEMLSAGHPHLRIDLFYTNAKIYFGEFTFFDSSGYDNNSSDEWDIKCGEWLNLPSL